MAGDRYAAESRWGPRHEEFDPYRPTARCQQVGAKYQRGTKEKQWKRELVWLFKIKIHVKWAAKDMGNPQKLQFQKTEKNLRRQGFKEALAGTQG